MGKLSFISILIALSVMILAGCDNEPPSRDHMPALQKRLYELQVAVARKDRAAIDSLLSVDILSIGETSDSLLSFVYGPDSDFIFNRFGNYQIFYTDDIARIDCFVMDSLGQSTRPIVLTLVNQHDLWLLKRFEIKSPEDSIIVSQ